MEQSGIPEKGSSSTSPHLKKTAFSLVDDGKRCPACGKVLPSDAVVCTQCGRNVMTGRTLPERKNFPGRRVGRCVIALVLVSIVALLWPCATGIYSSIKTRWSGFCSDDRHASSGNFAGELQAYLDRERPMWQAGDRAELRRKDGQIIRGVFVALQERRVIVEAGTCRIETTLDELDEASRVRCSREERELFVQKTVETHGLKRTTLLISLVETLLGGSKDTPVADVQTNRPGDKDVSISVVDTNRPGDESRRAAAQKQLDEKNPPFQAGHKIALVLKTGRVVRGNFEGSTNNILNVVDEFGKTNSLTFDTLRVQDRLRCDRAFRNGYVEVQMKLQTGN